MKTTEGLIIRPPSGDGQTRPRHNAPPMKKESPAEEASPYKSATEELDALRKTFRVACRHYAERVDMEIIRLRECVATAGEAYRANDRVKAAAGPRGGRTTSKPDANFQLHDLRDMLTLLRTLEVKPVAGRRRDLKKIEAAVDDLRMLIERWE